MDNELISLAEDVRKKLREAKIKEDSFSPNVNLEDKLSIQKLNTIKNAGDLPRARFLEGNDNRISFFRFKEIITLKEYINSKLNVEAVKSGIFWYPSNGYCGWHTNSDTKLHKPNRLYLTWAQEDKKSFFRYQDNSTGEIKTNYDTKGWQIRKFKLSSDEESLYWHCVGSQTNRVSIGFAY
jgi:hypothetical protein